MRPGTGLARAVYEQALRTPRAVAVADGERRLDYGELSAAGRAVAEGLRRAGVRPGEAVALALPRSWRQVCAMLGVLRLGARVVPLDLQSPPERRRHILTDSAAVAVIHDGTPPDAPDAHPDPVHPLSVAGLLATETGALGEQELPEAPFADAPVSFLFYTSGTTGVPKGVEVRDAGILRLAMPGYIRTAEGARFAALANPAFDAVSFEVWVPLLTGGCSVILGDEAVRTPHELAAALERERIDTVFVTTALFNAVVDTVPDCFSGVGQVLVGGEQLNAALIRRWYEHNASSATRLHNVYGPTEATTFALCHAIPRDFAGDRVPIGRALPETGTLLVVPGTERTAAPGETAELLLSGAGLAAGYRRLPEETERRFVRLPWHDGGRTRHYRTGDLVRADADGVIEYIGRADRQVKVRGFRIEPGEVERRIVAHPAVRQAYVCTRRDGEYGPNELLAYVVCEQGLSFEEFDRHLAAGLPAYMRPHHLHRVDALPRNANGKVDRAALLRRDTPPWRPDSGGAPAVVTTARQREVLDLASGILGVPDVRLDDRWIALGGDSLKALRLRFEVRRRWGRELPQRAVLDADLAGIAEAVGDMADGAADGMEEVPAAGGAGGSPYPVPAAPSGARTAPATSEQQRLWFLQQRFPGSRAYHVGQAFRLDGTVDAVALRRALRGLVERHPALRTAFEAAPEGLRQVVGEPYDPWSEPGPGAARDEAGAVAFTDAFVDAFTDAFFGHPFEPAEPRMFRACWLPSDGGGVLLLHLHHIAVDGWSLNVLLADLSAGYADALRDADTPTPAEPAPLPAPLPESGAPTPLDYAVWQNDWFAAPAYREQRRALRDHYAGPAGTAEQQSVPPTAHPFSPGRLLHTSLDAGRRASVDRLCAELGLTRFELMYGVFACSLYGVTGMTRPRLAGPVANRPVREFEDSVGMFANTVLLPLTVAPRAGLRDQVARLGAGARAVLERQDVALADVLADRESGPGTASGRTGGVGTSPFDFLFVLENTDFSALALPGCDSRPVWSAPAEAKCPMTLSVVERADGLDCLWEYADDHFEAAEVAALADLFTRGLDLLAEGAATTPAELAAPYRRTLPEPGRGATAPLTWTTVAEGFARQVARAPAAPALNDGGRDVSYAELDTYAAALAAELRAAHRLPEEDDAPCHVALHLEPSVEHVVALLALARLNLTVVPLDPSYPPALLRGILERVRPLCVLLPPGGEAAFDTVDPGGIARHTVALSTAAAPPVPPHHGARPLYTLFTSGSTGVPKGVRVSDRTLCNLLQWQAESGGLAGSAVTQQFSMLSFDVSFQEIFGTLCGGGRLHLVRPAWRQDPPALLAQLESAGAERVFMPYVALQLLAEHAVHLGRYPTRLREVVTAGEQLVCTDAIRRWFAGMPGARLFNHYGPTETHVVSALRLDGDPAHWPERPAIGRPVAGAVLRVVDGTGEPVPPGHTGDLLIGGTMATRCYLGDPALNETRFVQVPGLGLFYRSGDRASFDREGLLHYRGRDDRQIKLSGHRLELGEVEAALLRHPEIVQAVVVRDGERLVACLQFRGQAPTADTPTPRTPMPRTPPVGTPTVRALTAHLAPLLPPHVRIDRFRRLDALPRTPSGKLDREGALRAPGEELPRDSEGPGGIATVPPETVAGGPSGPEARREARPEARLEAWPETRLEARLAAAFEAATGSPIRSDQTFFDAGASSLGLMRFHLRCTTELGLRLTVADLFEHVTLRALARFLDGRTPATDPATSRPGATAGEPIAVVGMAVRLPGAADLGAFWEMVRTGGSGIEYFDAPDGVVGARSQLDGPLAFDPDHFSLSRQEARLMDPQQRHLLMSCADALAHAGIADPSALRVGLVAGAGENTYFQAMLREADPALLPDGFQLALHHEKDFLATKAAYHLGLTGPAFTAQAACASSLVAVHLAAGLLRQGDADVMLAGGVLIDLELTDGYRYRPQHIFSADGHCRPFSDDASGTVGASGVGVVVLKPLSLAERDGDTVYSVITGSALNNDGSEKLSYSAPSLTGQREVIRAALRRAGRTGADLGHVEAHGTGTTLGDPVEVGALRQALDVTESGRCALSSVKSQIGHLGAAAGVVGLIRATLAVHHCLIPPHSDFRALNPRIGPDPTPFHIPAEARPWPAGRDRVAAVSSFGIGGTNAHVILEAAGRDGAFGPASPPITPCLTLSSSSESALRADAARIAGYLTDHPEAYGEVLRHVQAGRPARRWRIAAVCQDAAEAVAWLRTAVPVAVDPAGDPLPATGRTARELAEAWTAGRPVDWPAGPAQAPWDFPPPAFATAEYDFARATRPTDGSGPAVEEGPRRLPEAAWLHQPQWVRLRHAATTTAARTSRLLVVMTDGPVRAETIRAFEAGHARVVPVVAAGGFARRDDGGFEVDPADPASLRTLLDALAEAGHDGIDWLHTLPLGLEGPVGANTLERARWACLDTPAALLRAVAEAPGTPRLRPWWLSYGARPVDGPVRRPEANLLAGAVEVAPQEGAPAGRWLDLPSAEPADWAPQVAALLAGSDDTDTDTATALRQGFWWERITLPVSAGGDGASGLEGLAGADSVHLVLGGTGGIGTAVAAWLLERTGGRVLLLARTPLLPPELTPWADRVELIGADLAGTAPEEVAALIGGRTGRLDSVIHAAGVAAGGLIARRDATAMRAATAAKVRGALLTELLIARHLPGLAVYCSSMSALLGGVGQFDYAASNALLDGFAHHRSGDGETTVRLTVNWDVWREAGMALRAPRADARHQAHLTVGLTVAEGKRLFGRAVALRLPQLLVSTTDLDASRVFYEEPAAHSPAAVAATPADVAVGLLTDRLCEWMGVDHLDPDVPLYDLGADSLTMLDLISEVKRHFGVELELSWLSHRVSLTEILTRLATVPRDGASPDGPSSDRTSSHAASSDAASSDVASSDVELEIWQEGTGRDVLCLVHPVGGDIQAYRSLVSALDPRLTVCLIPDPALRRPGLPEWTLADRARRYHAALLARFPAGEWRLRLAGWSFGAWVAAEMAAEAEAAGRAVASLDLLDPPPPGSGARFQAYDETQLDTVFAAELDHSGGASAGENARAYAERLAACCRANLRSMAAHRVRPLAATPARLWPARRPVAGVPSLGSPEEQWALWRPYLPEPRSWHPLDTTHYGVVRQPYVAAVAEAINAATYDTPRSG
ncbi:amino acid adenylation domain-containing protein [Streptomyces sp. JV176]|uniref:non-ribosomal peptide synthetase n=1 Tax=Streptomyces sp. JV176 TaxID=858630 RepID=UPI002E78E3F6|nr:non-ribosomal peptide synthetase [Streptomyces sp. JV176]MEE1800999.1 amino acid adenylation domain-containing protein [Streptomyces sp. JV176]